MDSDAWAGWAALKMVSETVARTQSADPKQVMTYLREEMAFDGQKGIPHTFRNNGQLRQPLLIVEAGKLVGEELVARFVSYLGVSRAGLSEQELRQLIDPGDPLGNDYSPCGWFAQFRCDLPLDVSRFRWWVRILSYRGSPR